VKGPPPCPLPPPTPPRTRASTRIAAQSRSPVLDLRAPSSRIVEGVPNHLGDLQILISSTAPMKRRQKSLTPLATTPAFGVGDEIEMFLRCRPVKSYSTYLSKEALDEGDTMAPAPPNSRA